MLVGFGSSCRSLLKSEFRFFVPLLRTADPRHRFFCLVGAEVFLWGAYLVENSVFLCGFFLLAVVEASLIFAFSVLQGMLFSSNDALSAFFPARNRGG